jgi:hypothetical protein
MRREEVDLSVPLRAADIDLELHKARGDRRRRVTYEAILNELPNDSFIELEGSAYLVWNDALLLWTPERYSRKEPRPNGLAVTVLTPQPTVQCLRQGYQRGGARVRGCVLSFWAPCQKSVRHQAGRHALRPAGPAARSSGRRPLFGLTSSVWCRPNGHRYAGPRPSQGNACLAS